MPRDLVMKSEQTTEAQATIRVKRGAKA
jgi:hypothetical protein